ncbi:MAG: DUF1778 domain-containing protein [Actinomycetota bacterium]|nr:DUF1778 domain-containing protein [Actinomycetota bacterium]
MKQHQDLVLSRDVFDRFVTELDKPAKSVPELVELFKKNPKLREAYAASRCDSNSSTRTTASTPSPPAPDRGAGRRDPRTRSPTLPGSDRSRRYAVRKSESEDPGS